MGMPNAYKCEICGIDVHFPGTQGGKDDLTAHYESDHLEDPVPNDYNAYKCHHRDCDVYRSTACEIVEHDRSAHTGR